MYDLLLMQHSGLAIPLMMVLLILFYSQAFNFMSVSGELIIKQVPTNGDPSWNIRGVATYQYGGSNPRMFHFHCISTTNNGSKLSWERRDGQITKMQTNLINQTGVSLEFTSPVESDSGVYACVDEASTDEAVITMTSKNPAALAAQSSLSYCSGDTVIIDMYVSALTPIQQNQISWRFDGVKISDGFFANNKTSLVIHNASHSSAGVYEMIITVGGGTLMSSDVSNTSLTILDAPIVTVDPETITVNEGDMASFNCSVSNVFGASITWYQEGKKDISLQSQSGVLVISNTKSDDAGTYYCEAVDSEGLCRGQNSVILEIKSSPVISIPPPLLPVVYNTTSSSTFSATSATSQSPTELIQTDTPTFVPTTDTSGWGPIVIVMVVLVVLLTVSFLTAVAIIITLIVVLFRNKKRIKNKSLIELEQ